MSAVVLTPAAQGDLLRIIAYLEGDNPNAVLKVVDALDENMQRLADNPGVGHLRPDLTDQRRSILVRVQVFDHLPTGDEAA
jgi:plasmid stabilization system protein ParE